MIRLIAGCACKAREHKGSANIAAAPATKILRLIMAIPLQSEGSWNNNPAERPWPSRSRYGVCHSWAREARARNLFIHAFCGVMDSGPAPSGASRNDERRSWPFTALVQAAYAPRQAEMLRAFSSEVDTGSREENASKQQSRASVLIQSEPKML
ncbi:hypothetical protein I6F35_03380 [Bradyrhizobium sp. BRP22]|uniref:hypothetical protein n=1 Tax=Bradyrhizobium sp. BRP22 TaxID=2793821 RepID=UPI001CD21856|nr:hypothetical protein [Bradyrhizobium sp. BRP22]MCA1452259.1 hypothetical protein [Bradyrhizobium sp. BRP22]